MPGGAFCPARRPAPSAWGKSAGAPPPAALRARVPRLQAIAVEGLAGQRGDVRVARAHVVQVVLVVVDADHQTAGLHDPLGHLLEAGQPA